MSSPNGKRVSLDDQQSVSDGDMDIDKKRKRARRRRGHRGRYRPYDVAEAEGEHVHTGSDRKLRLRKEMPMAPSNTTQFLLEDVEERTETERKVEEVCAEERRRIRSISVSSELLLASDDGSDSWSDPEHRDFETEFDEFNRDRISHLSKVELEKEVMAIEKTAEVYHDSLIKMNKENERLRRLLKDNGIPYDNSTAKTNVQPQPVA
ncbi:unnamed protein product [Auanema sp. JU1783]|nr:unnamed protein product [Auanema sp. JU1783]